MIAQVEVKSLQALLARRQQMAGSASGVGLPDAAAYYFFKQASFLSKKEQRWTFFLFQGLNTNPQNLSIYLRDEAHRESKGKERLARGVFMVHDLFSRSDVVIEISIPGNLRIWRNATGKKELVGTEDMDLAYLSSCLRAMQPNNLPWGRYYHLFHDAKDYQAELRNFYTILFRAAPHKDISLGNDFDAEAHPRGSHLCALVFNHMRERRLVRLSIEAIEQLFSQSPDSALVPKFALLLAELYLQAGKPSRSLQVVQNLLLKQPNEPYLLYYQARYLFKSGQVEAALSVTHWIVQLNQIEIWLLLASIHLELRSYPHMLVCLNHAVRLSKSKPTKPNDYRGFEELGKAKPTGSFDSIEMTPKLLVGSDSPLTILVKEVEEKNKFLLEKPYWRLNGWEKQVYLLLQHLRYRTEPRRFEELLTATFEDSPPRYDPVLLRKGMGDPTPEMTSHRDEQPHQGQQQEADLPEFLKNSSDKVEESVSMRPSRNLSIIPEIESVIENSNYEQRERERGGGGVKLRREVQEGLFRLVQAVLGEGEFERAEYESDVSKVLHIYNKLRTASKTNSYFADRMFRIFQAVANYRSIIVLVAETLDFLEQRGVKKIDKLPYWMHKYLFFIIEEKGLKFLNEMLQKLNFYDEAVIDTIEIAKKWKLKGVTY